MEGIKQELVKKIEATKDHLVVQLATIRSSGASAGLLDRLVVDVYGQKTPLNNIATITVPNAKQLLIQPWDKANAAAIEKAVLGADLGLGVTNEGDKIRINVPSLSNERREELVKVVNKLSEATKVSVRNARRDALEELEVKSKEGGISDDEKERFKKEYQALIDKEIIVIEDKVNNKTEELQSL